MIGPFSIGTYLPSFPAIARDFGVGTLELQQTLSVYLASFAVMTLFHGTLSDSFGRQPVILAGLEAGFADPNKDGGRRVTAQRTAVRQAFFIF
ncbi:MAG TPA: hypothetical protein VLT92_07170 [Burkholderiales bacterium]|nr:hypothetical protein [Burkholderiales bacterium]